MVVARAVEVVDAVLVVDVAADAVVMDAAETTRLK